ncbi:MAG: hypothetical protein K0U98_11430 [Deltaproteobacteria bacterium]|nr:hypothetical protein [Deltaproteobacteria bacterium]
MKPLDVPNWEIPELKPEVASRIGQLVCCLAKEGGLYVAMESAIENMQTLRGGSGALWALTLLDALEEEFDEPEAESSDG